MCGAEVIHYNHFSLLVWRPSEQTGVWCQGTPREARAWPWHARLQPPHHPGHGCVLAAAAHPAGRLHDGHLHGEYSTVQLIEMIRDCLAKASIQIFFSHKNHFLLKSISRPVTSLPRLRPT